jgi:hypothetical protein
VALAQKVGVALADAVADTDELTVIDRESDGV